MLNIVVTFLFFTKIVSNHQLEVPTSDDLLLANDKILGVVDDILITLKISDDFKKYKTVPEYITIHNYIQDAVATRNEKYEELYKVIEVTVSNKTAFYITNINAAIGEMISEHKATTDMYFKKETTDGVAVSNDDVIADFVHLAKKLRLNLNLTYSIIPVKDKKIPRNPKTRRIYAGTKTELHEWPFIASIHIRARLACVGSIVREDMVVTAATCFLKFFKKKLRDEYKRNIWVRVGSDKYNSGGYLLRAKLLHFHPRFNRENWIYNLAVVQLKVRIVVKLKRVQPIKYAREKTKYRDIDILGWGKKSIESKTEPESPEFVRLTELPTGEVDSRRLPRFRRSLESSDLDFEDGQLLHAVMDGFKLEQCRQIYRNHSLNNRNFCAGSRNTGSGACKFDLGAPGIIGDKLHGVVSFGPSSCGKSGYPTVFTKVYKFAKWFDKLFCSVPLSNDTMDDSRQGEGLDELGPDGKRVRYTDESFILNEIKRDIQAGYRNPLDYLDLNIEKDDVHINLRQGDQDTPVRNNIYLDPTLANSKDVFEKLEEESNSRNDSETYNWAHYKEFIAQAVNNNSKETRTETESSFEQSTAAETVSLLSEMQEEYEVEGNVEQNVQFEYDDIPQVLNEKGKVENVEFKQDDALNIQNNGETKQQPQIDKTDPPHSDDDNAHTQNIEFVYDDAPNNDDSAVADQASDVAEIVITDSGTTQKLLLNKKDPSAVHRFVDELNKLKDRIASTSTRRVFYRGLEDNKK